ncbi:MAG: PaaI family thioesterase [Candidatus Sabulitectum sp.]|nr:PaaI family thioesterase [Candidatus Sabulitectum sp.]
MAVKDLTLLDDDNCFACGSGNPIGLKLKFRLDRENGTAVTETVIADHFNGWKGAVHGGIITTLLDEIMVYACTSSGWFTVTGTIEVKFHKPVPTEELLTVKGRIEENRGRSILTSATLELKGQVLASAKAVLIPVKFDENSMDSISERLID